MSLDDARRLVEGYVERYNNVRLNSLAGRQQKIHAERDWKLEDARKPAADSSAEGRVKNEY